LRKRILRRGKAKGEDGLKGRAAKRAYREYPQDGDRTRLSLKAQTGRGIVGGRAVGSEKGAVVLRTMDKAAFEKKTE